MSRIAFVLTGLMMLTACGKHDGPIAQKIVDQIVGEDGLVKPLYLVDKVIQAGVPANVANLSMMKYDEFSSKVKKTRHMVIVDFTQTSEKKRMYLIDAETGTVDAMHVAHGEGSDPDDDGYAQYFSNTPGSRMSSLGSYLVQERYVGKWGASMKLDGLERTNSNARKRVVVMHPASYVKDQSEKKQGLSWGCPATPFDWIDTLIERLRDGSFMYIYGENEYRESAEDLLLQQMSLLPNFKWIDESDPR